MKKCFKQVWFSLLFLFSISSWAGSSDEIYLAFYDNWRVTSSQISYYI